MKKLSNLAEDVMYGRKGFMNENDEYEFILADGELSEEELEKLEDEAIWFEDYEGEINVRILHDGLENLYK